MSYKMENLYNNLALFIQTINNGEMTTINDINDNPLVETITAQIKDLYAPGYNVQNANLINPIGYFGIPNDNMNAIVANILGGNKLQVILGFLTVLALNTPMQLEKGECGHASNNWGLITKNDSVLAYKLDDAAYCNNQTGTLASGPWIGKILLDILNRLDNIDIYLNAHIHTGVQAGEASSGPPSVDILPDPNLVQDVGYINGGNYLLNENAMVVPS